MHRIKTASLPHEIGCPSPTGVAFCIWAFAFWIYVSCHNYDFVLMCCLRDERAVSGQWSLALTFAHQTNHRTAIEWNSPGISIWKQFSIKLSHTTDFPLQKIVIFEKRKKNSQFPIEHSSAHQTSAHYANDVLIRHFTFNCSQTNKPIARQLDRQHDEWKNRELKIKSDDTPSFKRRILIFCRASNYILFLFFCRRRSRTVSFAQR